MKSWHVISGVVLGNIIFIASTVFAQITTGDFLRQIKFNEQNIPCKGLSCNKSNMIKPAAQVRMPCTKKNNTTSPIKTNAACALQCIEHGPQYAAHATCMDNAQKEYNDARNNLRNKFYESNPIFYEKLPATYTLETGIVSLQTLISECVTYITSGGKYMQSCKQYFDKYPTLKQAVQEFGAILSKEQPGGVFFEEWKKDQDQCNKDYPDRKCKKMGC